MKAHTPLHLLLIRHAKSSWQDAAQADHDRPLAERGIRNAPDMAARIAYRGRLPQLVITSSARRARDTARLMLPQLRLTENDIRVEPALYLASPRQMLGTIHAQDATITALAVVGHNPGITELVEHLLPDVHLDNLPTAGVFSILSDVKRWQDVAMGNCTLDFYDFPKLDFPPAHGRYSSPAS